MARSNTEINASSTADIAFLLLIFYLVTTTMNVDSGISRTLPPIADPNQIDEGLKINRRNTLQISINFKDQIVLVGENGASFIQPSEVKDIAKEFIMNPNNDIHLPEKVDTEIDIIGTYPVSKGVISLKNDRTTSYSAYIQVQNELTKAYNEVWNELSTQKFGKVYTDLTDEQKTAIRAAIPNKISEAEPVDLSKKK